MEPQYEIYKTPGEMAEHLAGVISKRVNAAAGENKYLTLAISGGSTPRLLFSVLTEKYGSVINWNIVHLFWVDERCVPPDDPESNFGMTKRILLDTINIPACNIHRMRGEEESEQEARRYGQEIVKFTVSEDMMPVFDIIVLGMGDDGHTASIFPGNEKLLFSEKICETAVHPLSGQRRITLTGKVINNAREVYFLVTGVKKSAILKHIFCRDRNYREFPAAHINPRKGAAMWLIDEEAAMNLK